MPAGNRRIRYFKAASPDLNISTDVSAKAKRQKLESALMNDSDNRSETVVNLSSRSFSNVEMQV